MKGIIRLPGLIDPHVHFRTPGQSHKEDFSSGTKAALAGGFTTVLDMPNNQIPITTEKLLRDKQKLARKKVYADVGFFFGSLGENLDEFKKVYPYVFGLKIYLNQTTGGYIVDEKVFEKICEAWPNGKPILVHAEEDVIGKILKIGHQTKQTLHICHVSSKKELSRIISAKKKGWRVTCGVTPHHLFLKDNDAKRLGPFGVMKPSLKSDDDHNFIWKNLKWIDLVESDHAPHAVDEKTNNNPPFGVPGLETTLGLLMTSVNDGKLNLNDLKRLLHDGSAKIFNLKPSKTTYIELDQNQEWIVQNGKLLTKSNWSPFNGWKLRGKVVKAVLRNKVVFEKGRFLKPSGRVIFNLAK